ncbi:MAG: hypothetical protein J0M31_23100, partial [Candidatus Accumulibacter sp.]|nr:hypothetical protein [Accumulibacter sp.]
QQSLRWPHLEQLLTEVLAQDPRPAYADDAERLYGFRLFDLEIRWRCTALQAIVEEIVPVTAADGGRAERREPSGV